MDPVTVVVVLLSVAAGVVPMVGVLALIWWLDRYDREPIGLMAAAFAWGAFGASFIGFVGGTIGTIAMAAFIGPERATWMITAFGAPAIEETAKGLVVFAIYFHRKFDNLTDGIVYGAASGLGFAMVENPIYFIDTYASTGQITGWLANIVMRTTFTALMHMVAAACFGAALGAVKFRAVAVPMKVLVGVLGMLLAFGVHALWNGLIVATQLFETPVPFLLGITIFFVELFVVFAMFQGSLIYESRIIRRELREEARSGTLPIAHADVLCRFLRRRSASFVREVGADHARYVRFTTELAFRRWQLQRCAPAEQGWLEERTVELRARVRKILGAAEPPAAATSGSAAAPSSSGP